MAKSKRLKVIFAGGGTGGHLYPAIALAQEVEKRYQAEILFIGTSYGIENSVMPAMPYTFKKIWMRGLRRKMSLTNLLFPLRLAVSSVQSLILLLRFRPHVVIGTGGYVSGPVLLAGLLTGTPTVIQEQNSYPGLVNRLLGDRVRQLHLTFEESKKYFRRQENMFVSGNPVRGEFGKVDRSAALKAFNLSEDRLTLFIFGGSQGAHTINQTMLETLPTLMKDFDLQVVWATGTADFDEITARTKPLAKNITAQPYISDMASAYAASDIVICRAGASTLAEIAICGLPAILVPYPHAAADHQKHNARTLENSGGARMIEEKDLSPDTVRQTLTDLLEHPEQRERMAQKIHHFARPNAAGQIIAKIESLLSLRGVS